MPLTRRRKLSWLSATGFAVLSASSLPANAGTVTIFSNLGSGTPLNFLQSFVAGGADGSGVNPPNLAGAVEFTPSITSTLANVMIPIWLVTGTNQLSVSITQDSNDSPGTIVEQMLGSGFAICNGCVGTLATITSTLHPTLTAGIPYWLVVSAPNPSTGALWFWNPTNDQPHPPAGFPGGSNNAISQNGANGPWVLEPEQPVVFPGLGTISSLRPAFAIDGTVPEPAAFALWGGGLAALFALKTGRFRSRRNSERN